MMNQKSVDCRFRRRAVGAAVAGLVLLVMTAARGENRAPSCVWKITGQTSTVYLGGAIHVLRPQDRPYPSSYQIAYEDSERLWLETDLEDAVSPERLTKTKELWQYTDGTTLKDHISSEVWAELQTYFRSRNLKDTTTLEKVRPGLLASVIATLEASRAGIKLADGVDMVYFRKAKEDGKPLHALETLEFQFGMYNQLSQKEQEDLLRETIQHADDLSKTVLSTISAWKRGDVKSLDEILNRDFYQSPAMSRIFIYDRAAKWIPFIEKQLKQSGNSMFIVGTGVLIGPKGVIEQLRKRGYRVEQM